MQTLWEVIIQLLFTGQDPSELQAWQMVNLMISSWILNVVDPKLQTSVAYAESAQAMSTNLNKRYAISNAPKIHQLKASIMGANKEVSTSATNKFDATAEEEKLH